MSRERWKYKWRRDRASGIMRREHGDDEDEDEEEEEEDKKEEEEGDCNPV